MSEKTESSKSIFAAGSALRLWISFLGGIALIGYLTVTLWINLGSAKPVPDDKRQRIGIKAAEKVAEEIRLNRKEISSAVMVHFANDPTDFISYEIRNKLNSSGILNLDDLPLMEKIRNKLLMINEGCGSREEALAAAKGSKADGVLWGKVERYESSNAGVILFASWELVDLKSGVVIYSGKIEEDTTKSVAGQVNQKLNEIQNGLQPLEEAANAFPWYVRFLIFVLAVLLLPIFTIGFLRAMVVKRSNGINAFVLGIYTLIGAILAFFMVGAAFASGWSVALFLIATVFSFFYNAFLMNFALKLES